MKKILSLLALVSFFVVLALGLAYAQVEISGTWIGTTEVPDMGEDEVTLVLEKDNSGYSGTFSDSLGMADKAELEDVAYESGNLSFSFTIYNGSEYMSVSCSLAVKNDTMTGYWETEDGTTGEIEMKRQK